MLLYFGSLAPSCGQILVPARGYSHADLESQAGMRATGLDGTLSHAATRACFMVVSAQLDQLKA